VGRVFKELGLIEQWGSEIQRMCAACAEKGLPAPLFEEVGFRFRVTLRLMPIKLPQPSEVNVRIFNILDEAGAGGLTTSQIAAKAGLSSRAIRTRLNLLLNQGSVMVMGKSVNDPRRKFRRAGSPQMS
jgi:predicted HTH transcriptional regulator